MTRKKKEKLVRIFTIALVVLLAVVLAGAPIFMFFGG